MNASNPTIATSDPRLELWLRRGVWLGCSLLLVPAMRGHNEWLGWLPLWVLGMPLAAWWALHRFRLPQWPLRRSNAVAVRRRLGAQARRHRQPLIARRMSHAA